MIKQIPLAEESIESADAPVERPSLSPRRRPGITGAVILIGLGVALLLDTLGVVSISWLQVIRFWPVLLIIGGIDLLFGSRSIWGSLIAGIIAIFAISVILFTSWGTGIGLFRGGMVGSPIRGNIQEPLGDVTSLNAHLDIGLGETRVGVLPGGDDVVQGTYQTDSRFGISTAYQVREDTGILTISQHGNARLPEPMPYIGDLDILLSDAVPVNLDVKTGMGDTTLDLTGLHLTSLAIEAGFGTTSVTLPSEGGYSVDISAGLGDLEITLPAGVEARVDFNGGLSGFDSGSRLKKVEDGLWQTAGYSGSGSDVQIKIDAGVGSITVRDQ